MDYIHFEASVQTRKHPVLTQLIEEKFLSFLEALTISRKLEVQNLKKESKRHLLSKTSCLHPLNAFQFRLVSKLALDSSLRTEIRHDCAMAMLLKL